MLAIRLARIGARKKPSYRVVVIDKRRARDSKNIEIVGHYNPTTEPIELSLESERIDHWVGQGAQPSVTVRRLITYKEKGGAEIEQAKVDKAKAEAQAKAEVEQTERDKAREVKAAAAAEAEVKAAAAAEAEAAAAVAAAEAEAAGEAAATEEASTEQGEAPPVAAEAEAAESEEKPASDG
ncbi:MAG: 30S ribosomal protein S16 [Acidobacteria bacterium]|nr:30S ribosomal protein S16 [Acidobacteriota bacterium]